MKYDKKEANAKRILGPNLRRIEMNSLIINGSTNIPFIFKRKMMSSGTGK